jgi:AcrR family transcriptional regulator
MGKDEASSVGRPRILSLDELHRRVAAAAAQEFSQHGYDAARIDVIAAAAGVSKPVLYRAFGSKSDLYCTLLERFAADLATAAMGSFRVEQSSVVGRFRAIIDSWFRVLADHPSEWRMLNTATSTDPEIRSTVERVTAMQLRNDVTMIRSFLPSLPVAEVDPIAEALRGSLIAIGSWWLAHPAVPRDVAVDAMTRVCAGLFAVTESP